MNSRPCVNTVILRERGGGEGEGGEGRGGEGRGRGGERRGGKGGREKVKVGKSQEKVIKIKKVLLPSLYPLTFILHILATESCSTDNSNIPENDHLMLILTVLLSP